MGSQTDGADIPFSQPMRRITADMFDDDEIARCIDDQEEEEIRRAEEMEARWNQEVAWTEMAPALSFVINCVLQSKTFFFSSCTCSS